MTKVIIEDLISRDIDQDVELTRILAKANKLGARGLNKSETELYDRFMGREHIKEQHKLRDLKPFSFEEYRKTLEDRKALKMAKNDEKLYAKANPSDGNVVRIQTCGGNPAYRGYSLHQLVNE